jgi:hypothetical protein
MFASAQHCLLSQVRWNQSTLSHLNPLIHTKILPSQLLQRLLNDVSLNFSSKTLYRVLISPLCAAANTLSYYFRSPQCWYCCDFLTATLSLTLPLRLYTFHKQSKHPQSVMCCNIQLCFTLHSYTTLLNKALLLYVMKISLASVILFD